MTTSSSSAAKAAKGGNWRQPVLRTIWLGCAAASATHDKVKEELEDAKDGDCSSFTATKEPLDIKGAVMMFKIFVTVDRSAGDALR